MNVEEAEENLNVLKRKIADIPFVYEDCQKAIDRQKEIWERILHYSKGTDSEKQVYKKLDELEEKQREFAKVFSIADEEIESVLLNRKVVYENAEQLYEKNRKEDLNENNVRGVK